MKELPACHETNLSSFPLSTFLVLFLETYQCIWNLLIRFRNSRPIIEFFILRNVFCYEKSFLIARKSKWEFNAIFKKISFIFDLKQNLMILFFIDLWLFIEKFIESKMKETFHELDSITVQAKRRLRQKLNYFCNQISLKKWFLLDIYT